MFASRYYNGGIMFVWLKRLLSKSSDGPLLKIVKSTGGHLVPGTRILKPGMTLAPGESASLDLELLIDNPIIIEAIRRGEKTIEVAQGPRLPDGNGGYRSECEITINSELYGTFWITYGCSPPA